MEEQETEEEFDVSIYENDFVEENKSEDLGSDFFSKSNVPRITNIKAKYNLGEKEVEQIGELKGEIKKATIEIEAQLSNINELKRYYGLLSELWANLELVCGSLWINHVDSIRKKAWDYILEAEEKGRISSNVYNTLLKLRKDLYKISQSKNLGFAVERSNVNSGAFD
jgi:hypothetical protein